MEASPGNISPSTVPPSLPLIHPPTRPPQCTRIDHVPPACVGDARSSCAGSTGVPQPPGRAGLQGFVPTNVLNAKIIAFKMAHPRVNQYKPTGSSVQIPQTLCWVPQLWLDSELENVTMSGSMLNHPFKNWTVTDGEMGAFRLAQRFVSRTLSIISMAG